VRLGKEPNQQIDNQKEDVFPAVVGSVGWLLTEQRQTKKIRPIKWEFMNIYEQAASSAISKYLSTLHYSPSKSQEGWRSAKFYRASAEHCCVRWMLAGSWNQCQDVPSTRVLYYPQSLLLHEAAWGASTCSFRSPSFSI
jgi:hypothetical protein